MSQRRPEGEGSRNSMDGDAFTRVITVFISIIRGMLGICTATMFLLQPKQPSRVRRRVQSQYNSREYYYTLAYNNTLASSMTTNELVIYAMHNTPSMRIPRNEDHISLLLFSLFSYQLRTHETRPLHHRAHSRAAHIVVWVPTAPGEGASSCRVCEKGFLPCPCQRQRIIFSSQKQRRGGQ